MDVTINAVTSIIGIGGTVVGIVVGVAGSERIKKKDLVTEGANDGELKADTKHIRRQIDELVVEQRITNRTIGEHAVKIGVLEESVKSAHKRLDRIEEERG